MNLKYLLFIGLVLQLCVIALTASTEKDNCKCNKSSKKSKRRKAARKRMKREFSHLEFEDCGGDPDRPVHFLSVDLNPMPVLVPGRVDVAVQFNVTRPLTIHIGLKVTLSRYLFGIPFSMPCLPSGYSGFNIGSCVYEDMCGKINSYVEHNNGCPETLANKNIPCTCPINSGLYDLRDMQARIPRLTGLLGYIVQGDYKIQAELFDWNTKTELGCLQMKWSIRKRRRHERRSWVSGRFRRNADAEEEAPQTLDDMFKDFSMLE